MATSTSVFQALERKKQYKYPYLFLGLYLTCMLAVVCLANKLISISGLIVPGGILVFPCIFTICDIVGEVYGYAYPRLFIWIGVMAEFLFSLVVIGVSHTDAPIYFQHAEAYQAVFDPTFRYVLSGLTALLIGEFVNVYLLAKWKIALQGRLFVLRYLFSNAIGQAMLTIIVDLLNYTGKMPFKDILGMMCSGYLFKLSIAVILAFPAWLLIRFLKKVEHVDHYDVNTNFNPFMLSLDDAGQLRS